MLHNITAGRRQKRLLLALSFFIFHLSFSVAQIKIGGHVYGGGNEGYVAGNTTVTVRAGDLNNVFGGARVANVGGRTFVDIDGKHASDDILIVGVYGGNDISGTIGQNSDAETYVPTVLENTTTDPDEAKNTKNFIDNSWKTFVRTSACTTKETVTVGEGENSTSVTADDKLIVIGSLFGGGNGDYFYDTRGNFDHHYVFNLPYTEGDEAIAFKKTEPNEDGFTIPELSKTYLEIKGGCIAHIFGGGNNATVTDATTINIDNESDNLEDAAMVYAKHKGITNPLLVLADLQKKVKLTTFQSNLTSYAFNHARVFGGNNKATMNIMPKWNLQKGIIRDLYSGGNEGNMTYYVGLLLDIDPEDKDALVINNVYGGCRRADVYPLQPNGNPSIAEEIQLPNTITDNQGNPYHFPAGLAARTIVRGGKITNVYGGNDISGRVFGGNAIGIRTSILGDVYGGGNGSYAYTDNSTLGALDEYKDFYYNIDDVKTKENFYNPSFDATQEITSAEALNIFRPNAEQVSLRLWGESAANPTIIGGRVFVGGNSATLKPQHNLSEGEEPLIELKIGSNVYADEVFLGNNGEKMVNADAEVKEGLVVKKPEGILRIMKSTGLAGEEDTSPFNSMDLTDAATFATYMDGCAMTVRPKVVFDQKINETTGDPDTYKPYSSFFGSFYCGGNVGSMKYTGKNTINFDKKVIIFDKLVGGCNKAYVQNTDYNATYEGGLIGNPDDVTGDKLELNLSELKLQPKRWVNEANKSLLLEWNTKLDGAECDVPSDNSFTANDLKRRLVGGNVYGGCCESGHVNGNIVINLNGTIVDREGEYGVFDSATPTDGDPDILYDHENYTISTRRSGVILGEQGMDVLGEALSVFAGGKGEGTEVWGKATVNINKGYCFQVFGGSESGVIGKSNEADGGSTGQYTNTLNGKHYDYNANYSTYVNLNYEGGPGVSRAEDTSGDMADVEFIYGGGFEGLVAGDTHVNLGNGRLFNLFSGSCNADILGHTETYIGLNGFPYLRDHIYGGNDLGGEIKSLVDFSAKVRNYEQDKTMLHGYSSSSTSPLAVLQANSYVEYQQGHTKSIFGGCFGDYDYDTEFKDYTFPSLHKTFVNIRPNDNTKNQIEKVFGAGEGYSGFRGGDKMQDHSYVLIDIDDNLDNFKTTEVFGSGSNNGLGMGYTKDETLADGFDLDEASAIIDLLRGKIRNVFGGSHNEGVTRRTVVNVPENSTIWLYSEEPDQDVEADGTKTKHEKEYGNIFGGAYGTLILPPCDVYESNVNYRSDKAIVNGSIFGGNNNERRTLYANVNIYSPVWSHKDKEAKGYLSTVYGAGQGKDTWAEHTVVNLYDGAQVYEVYGGGMMGHVLNSESVQKYMQTYTLGPSDEIAAKDPYWGDSELWTINSDGVRVAKDADAWAHDWADAWTLGDYYTPDVDSNNDGVPESYDYTTYVDNEATNFEQVSERPELASDPKTASQLPSKKFNTNVVINEGAYVANYAYGGGYGKKKDPLSGDVYGTTYITLLGGAVKKDIYAAGTAGSIHDIFGVGAYNASSNPTGFTASANAFIKGGTCRNVYGGGWEGNVGAHTGTISADPSGDIPGETYVVIGNQSGTTFTDGIPAIQRNAYGGGEGGAVYGTAHLTLNNGYIGYQYEVPESNDPETAAATGQYVEKIEDDTQLTPNTLLEDAGCMFGGGYVDNSSVDKTQVKMYGGHVRNSVFGGGEIAAVGRGTMAKTTSGGRTIHTLSGLHRPGKTNIEMYGGNVYRNVYGGGRGYDNLGNHGSLYCDGYVFGQTEVHIHGGEIGTVAGLADGDGNVFGGGDEGFVYSAYENPDGTFGRGVKPAGSERYKDVYNGYYYKHKWEGDNSTGNNIDSDGFYTEDVTVGEGESATTEKERMFTEDCKVLVEPHMKVTTAVTINSKPYKVGDYVPIADLNTLQNKETDGATWNCLDQTGIIIHNAVFAGGNTPSGSLTTTANTASVFGNATASINDIYHRDMITLGTRHTGGLYGDGNLTLVDGYRELNITNYGTDYYSIAKQIGIDAYHDLPDREADYYELRYTCLKDCQDKDGTQYKKATKDDNGFTTKASTITADEMQSLFVTTDGDGNKASVKDGETDILIYNTQRGEWVPNPNNDDPYWVESGVLPVYAGRLMNSIQRADFCGVWGSRMVMQGAQDRVPEEIDYTNYTINRVREVSLNKKQDHGNYFGIYNIVNYLGALTSDVDFGDGSSGSIRTTDNTNEATYKCDADGIAYGTATFYDWKKAFKDDRKRNNGSSHNKVALASGVYLELTSEKSTGTGLYEKDWGPITGVIELDLINVSTGIGGGFVYAKNQHGVRSTTGHKNTTLTSLNSGAVTQWDYEYDTDDANKKTFETSGNFVHSTQTIIDDCYNVSNRYLGDDAMPAHYWYIKGSTYVYDQYISAYTGMPNAFSETVDIPLTIAAASHGQMKLLNVMPNRYAYYSSPGVKLDDGKKVVINDKEYYKNDPISYWDWYLLSASEKELFIENTYVNCVTCNIDGEEYEAGAYVLTKDEYDDLTGTSHTYTDADGNPIQDDNENADDWYIFRSSNIVSHDKGYILTYEVNNPSKWDNWFTLKSGDYRAKKTLAEYEGMTVEDKAKYYDGPTYRLNDDLSGGMLLGQRSYKVGELIAESIYDTYANIPSTAIPAADPSSEDYEEKRQAVFEEAYIVPSKITVTEGGIERHYYPGAAVDYTFANAQGLATADNRAYICTNSIQVTKEEVIYKDSKMSKSQADGYISDVRGKMNTIYSGTGTKTIEEIKALSTITAEKKQELLSLAALRDDMIKYLVPAYYCSTSGLYGGNYFKSGENYRALEAWSSLTETDHTKFTYNYDALDLLIDPNYTNPEGQKYQYDGNYASEEAVRDAATGNKAGYSVTQKVDYTATYKGSNNDETEDGTGKKYMVVSTSIISTGKVYVGDELVRDVFESLPNEQRHYTAISVPDNGSYYVVNTAFQIGSTPYAVGETISYETYTGLPAEEQAYVTILTYTNIDDPKTVYYCRESYSGHNIGEVIEKSAYDVLPNQQKNFTIHGVSPTETSTLFVSRESDIYDLSKEKIITVIYKYDYDETDSQGNVTPISERHVLNIHLTFKSGVPIVADISKPDIILPGNSIFMNEPTVTSGAYEVTGGGWELFENQRDAESHSNGVEYDPNEDLLYWYQDGYYIAYYAKSYAGRTYSNFVPVSVANYHDMKKVMTATAHHYYIDETDVKRAPKIYINDYSEDGENGLDLFKNLYDLSVLSSPTLDSDGLITGDPTFTGHKPLNQTQVGGGKNLEFFLRTDIDHSAPSGSPARTWTPIASGTDPCFSGTLHGDGHTISGLTPAEGTTGSLFGKLCGSVYNLGVTGSFTGGGVVDTGDGYVESCWVKTSATSTELSPKPYPVFGAPSDNNGYQVVNSYYCVDNKALYTTTDGDAEITYANNSKGNVTGKSANAFYNGEVAYDLNNFYLYKRYNDNARPEGTTTYKYWKAGEDAPLTGTYASNVALCSSGFNGLKYVENRFADGDFIYDGGNRGVIPDPGSQDERYFLETVTNSETGVTTTEVHYYPIWPDDYLFFGQKLTYGHTAETHQEVPSVIVKKDKRLSQMDDANRVYRAPAYFRSGTMNVAHFNPKAVFAQTKKGDGNTLAHKDMTAIDFTGSNGDVAHVYEKGNDSSAPYASITGGAFYPPLLDDDGLTGFLNVDLTRNLLVYTADAGSNTTAAEKTATVVGNYLTDPVYTESTEGYRKVAKQLTTDIHGHWVEGGFATRDHLLVDKQDFNAPINYTFDAGKRMWYQRTPENYAGQRTEIVSGSETTVSDRGAGWEGISLPFSAELVTTDEKGEITHFYDGSETSKNGTDTKISHEYWLRRLENESSMTLKTGETKVLVANFTYPNATDGSVLFQKAGDNAVTNTFLWDYYYQGVTGGHNQEDLNSDIYQKYYSKSRDYVNYPLLTNGIPYLLGLPGTTFYEFDLSGVWEATTTHANKPAKLNKQTITFASVPGTTILVSDGEMGGSKATYSSNDYYFKPNYLNSPSLDANKHAFLLNAEGSSYVEDNTSTTVADVSAFRPYFMAPASGLPSRELTRSIVFYGDGTIGQREGSELEDLGGISAHAERHKIVVSSTRKYVTDVRIVNTAGQVIATMSIKPGETIETQIINGGVYIVQDESGEYIKKLAVR